MLLLAISVLHSEQFNSYSQLLNSYQAYFPLTMQISTSNEPSIQSKRCTVYPTHKASLMDVTQLFHFHGK